MLISQFNPDTRHFPPLFPFAVGGLIIVPHIIPASCQYQACLGELAPRRITTSRSYLTRPLVFILRLSGHINSPSHVAEVMFFRGLPLLC